MPVSKQVASAEPSRQIHVSPDGHFLVEADGSPFFWLQDWAYELFKLPNREEADRYLEDRSAKGFNVIMAPITGIIPRPLTRPNAYGELPFIDTDPLRPNPRYFDNVDWIIERAAYYGLSIGLLPTWGLGPITGSFESPQPFNSANAEHYGRWLAARYRSKPILWVLGGDMNPLWPEGGGYDPLGRDTGDGNKASKVMVDYTPVFDAFARGILEGSGGSAFITYHPTAGNWPGTPQARTSLYFRDSPWLHMNMIQSGHSLFPEQWIKTMEMESIWHAGFNYEPINDEYHSKPVRPVIDGEPPHEYEAINFKRENGYWKAYDVRNSVYHALFAGAAGIAYANVSAGMLSPELNLHVEMPPQRALSSAGSEQMQYAKALMLSRPYFTRVPDQAVIVGESGRGVAHIGATRDQEGSYAMIYLPHGQQVTVDLSKISGKSAEGWFDPRTGEAMAINGIFSTSKPQTFEPPSGGADTDWILVLDDKSREFPPPGVVASR